MEEKIVFEAKKTNWGQRILGKNNSTIFKVYDSKKMVVEKEFDGIKPPQIETIMLSLTSYGALTLLISSVTEEDIKQTVYALDGVAWEMIKYNDNEVEWKRSIDHIYGIEAFEKIANFLYDILNNENMEKNDK